MEKFFTTTESAAMCKVSRGTILRWIREGRLRASSTLGGHHRLGSKELIGVLTKLQMPIPKTLISSRKEKQSKKVLIVDDDRDMRKFVERVFRKHFKEYTIEEASDGFTAGYKIYEMKPDVLILDIMLPGIDGYAICRSMRKNHTHKPSTVIAISAQDEDSFRHILDLGADEVMQKPFTAEALQRVLTSCFNGSVRKRKDRAA